MSAPTRLGAGRYVAVDERPAATVTSVHELTTADGPIVVDRRATGCRHAVWYSCVAGVAGGRIVQHDKDALQVDPA